MTSPQQLADRFYEAFARRDHETMGACYEDGAQFSDPVFVGLVGDEVRGMWRMLCQRGHDLEIEHRTGEVFGDAITVEWRARYTFRKTGRRVENQVEATLMVRDGLIVEHTDRFSFWRWSRQALGLPGWALGWTSALQGRVQRTSRAMLADFLKREAE